MTARRPGEGPGWRRVAGVRGERGGEPGEQADEVALGVVEGGATVEHPVVVDDEGLAGAGFRELMAGALGFSRSRGADRVGGGQGRVGPREVAAGLGDGWARDAAEAERWRRGTREEGVGGARGWSERGDRGERPAVEERQASPPRAAARWQTMTWIAGGAPRKSWLPVWNGGRPRSRRTSERPGWGGWAGARPSRGGCRGGRGRRPARSSGSEGARARG